MSADVEKKNVKEDMIEKVKERLHSEIADSKMYLDAAIAMENADNADQEVVMGLYEMAKDEYSHAYFFKNYLDKHDIDIPESCEKSFKELEAHVHRVFR